jgi:hypothetical protein
MIIVKARVVPTAKEQPDEMTEAITHMPLGVRWLLNRRKVTKCKELYMTFQAIVAESRTCRLWLFQSPTI